MGGTLASDATNDVTRNERPATRQFGRYRVVRDIAAGGMGAVYLAHDDMLRRDVAIKTIVRVPGMLAEEFRARFMNEARCIAALKHPNIVPVYDMGIEDDVPFLVMEVVSGASLKEVLADAGSLSPAEVRALGIQIANALAEAHRAGILHRDLKPANIVRDTGDTWKLVDFGIARAPDSSLTAEGQFLGTPAYASPETLIQYDFSPAADVWGLAATLYEAVCGTAPYGRGTGVQIALAATQRAPEPLSSRAPDVPKALADAIMAGLAKDPTARPDAAELARRIAAGPRAAEAVATPLAPAEGGPVGGVISARGPSASPSMAAPHTADTAMSVVHTPQRVRSRIALPAIALALIASMAAVALVVDDDPAPAPSAAPADDVDDGDDLAPTPDDPPPKPAPAIAPRVPDPEPTDRAAVGAPEPGTPDVSALLARAKRNSRGATRELDKLRKQHPTSAYLPFVQGRLYFQRRWWKDGFEAYRAAIANDPRYREHGPLIQDAVGALTSQSQAWRAQRFLQRDIGRPALPYLDDFIDATKNARVRSRAERTRAALQKR